MAFSSLLPGDCRTATAASKLPCCRRQRSAMGRSVTLNNANNAPMSSQNGRATAAGHIWTPRTFTKDSWMVIRGHPSKNSAVRRIGWDPPVEFLSFCPFGKTKDCCCSCCCFKWQFWTYPESLLVHSCIFSLVNLWEIRENLRRPRRSRFLARRDMNLNVHPCQKAVIRSTSPQTRYFLFIMIQNHRTNGCESKPCQADGIPSHSWYSWTFIPPVIWEV